MSFFYRLLNKIDSLDEKVKEVQNSVEILDYILNESVGRVKNHLTV